MLALAAVAQRRQQNRKRATTVALKPISAVVHDAPLRSSDDGLAVETSLSKSDVLLASATDIVSVTDAVCVGPPA
jgi:hypothetical protein